MTTYPNERVQEALKENDKFFQWVEKHPSFEAAWTECSAGNWMIGFLLKYTHQDRRLHWIGLRAARRALEILSASNRHPTLVRALQRKEGWLRLLESNERQALSQVQISLMSDISLEVFRIEDQCSKSLSEEMSVNSHSTAAGVYTLEHEIAKAVYNAVNVMPYGAGMAAAPTLRAFRCSGGMIAVAAEALRESQDVREFFSFWEPDPPPVIRTRFEREWVI
mgnify:CR=1 FL=1